MTVTVNMSDCLLNKTGYVSVSGSQIYLKHTGDACTLQCPSYASEVRFHQTKVTIRHSVGFWGQHGPKDVQTVETDYTLKTGDTHPIGAIKEQYQDGEWFVEDVNETIGILSAKAVNGADIPPDNTPMTYNWSCTDVDGKELSAGSAASLESAKNEIAAYDNANPGKPFKGEVKDSVGDVLFSRLYNQPEGGEIPWMWIGIGVTVAVIIAIILIIVMKSGHGATSGAPVPAPVAAPASVVVVK